MSNDESDDRIEATIRRIEVEKAARAANQARANAEPLVEHRSEPVPGIGPDESLIDATIRRIESEQAARASQLPTAPGENSAEEPATDDVPSLEDVGLEREIVATQPDSRVLLPPATDHEATTAQIAAPFGAVEERSLERLEAGPPVTSVVARLEQGLSETNAKLRALTARFEELLPVLDRIASSQVAATANDKAGLKLRPVAVDDEWDDAPQLPRVGVGAPPRPPIFREPAAQTAIARQPETLDASAAQVDTRRGFELLPRHYRITVEDKRRGVDLVPLHRGLLGLNGVKDMSLLSYSNGVAIVALEATSEINPDALGAAVSHAMARETTVEVHNEQTMVVKLAD